ncbi:MAG: pilus assembly protein [Terricaulis sp.]
MLKRFARAKSGVAAIEFALMLPLVVLGFLGANEVSSAVQVSQKVSQTASTTADLVAQASAISNSDMTNIFSAANAIAFPYSTDGESIVVSSLGDIGGGKGKVLWSSAQNGTGRTVGSTITMPVGIMPTNGTVILAEVNYPFTPTTTMAISTTIQMHSQFYSRPRRVTSIPRTS